MDFLRAITGVAVAIFMMAAPHLGLPYMQAIPVLGGEEGGSGDGEVLARLDVEVGPRVELLTLDAHGNRSALRVLWADMGSGKLDGRGQGQGKIPLVSFVAATPSALRLGSDTLALRPGDEVAVEGFDGKWAFAPDGMVGVLRMEGSVLNARIGEKGLRALGTQEESIAPGWTLSGEPTLASNVTVRAGRTAFVSTEGVASDGPVKHIPARDVRINGALVDGSRWGEGALDAVSFVVAGPGVLKGEAGARSLDRGQRVEVQDFIGGYVVFFTRGDDLRVALEGYARDVRISAAADGPLPAKAREGPLASFDWSPASPKAGEPVKFRDLSTSPDAVLVSREWRFGDGQGSAERDPSHAYADDGSYQVTLVVTDNRLLTSIVTRNLTILNNPPQAAFETNPARPTTLDNVQFVDRSSDKDGRIVRWAWDLGDGATSQDQHPLHRFAKAGTYLVKLVVWDDDGQMTAFEEQFQVFNKPPTARFTWAPTDPKSGDVVAFQDQSTDEDGTVVSWAWDLGQGVRSSERNPTHAFAGKGPHRVSLTVKDDDGASNTWDTIVNVRNTPPVADFAVAPDPPAEGQAARFLDKSRDPDGRLLERIWSFGDGSISMEQEPTHTYSRGGTITVTLTVKDDDGARSTAMKTFQINRRPVAAFSFLPAVPSTQDPVRFNDTSVDPDGRVVAWAWDFGDGNTSAQRHPSHRFARAGDHTVTLQVTDEQGGVGTLRRVLNVTNLPPVADFSWLPAVPSTQDTATFTDLSRDPDGSIRSWSWDFGDGTSTLGREVAKRFPRAGLFPVALTVTDDTGATSTVVKSVRVNQAPVAQFTFSPTAPTVNGDVRFLDRSSDVEGPLASWAWEFGDGSLSSLPDPVHRYAASGVYQVRLTVTDADGAKAFIVKPVAVGSLAPSAAFQVATASPRAGSPVQFTDQSTDPDGRIVAWAWSLGDGATSQAQHPAHTYAGPGTYAVRLTVTDDSGKTGSVERPVTVFSSAPLEIFFRVIYPDGQAVDLTRQGVFVEFTEKASQVTLAKGNARPLQVTPDGLVAGTLQPGEWAAGDPVQVRVRIPGAQVDQTNTALLPASGDLGTMTLRMTLLGRTVLLPSAQPMPDARTYTDPTEQVRGVVEMQWKDGTPARGAQVVLRFAWEQLGVPKVPVEQLGSIAGTTDGEGRMPFAVPFNAGLAQGPGMYLPGQHVVMARADYVVLDGLATWYGGTVFTQDPAGLRALL